MTKEKAYQKDKRGQFYFDHDSLTNSWGVFGTESGFCYSTHLDKESAENESHNMNRNLKLQLLADSLERNK